MEKHKSGLWQASVPSKAEVDRASPKRGHLLCFFFSVLMLTGCGEFAIRDVDSLLFPGFYRSEVVGFLAGLGTTFAALPDLIGMLKRRSSKGMNPRMAAIMGTFQILWVYYGLLILSRPVILWNIIAVITNFFVVGAYFYFARKEKIGQGQPS
ncbi:SemiSWEET family sugar transporter [Nitrosomonas sp. Nm34]|uniref:SemiSWEET family sugar transporter n=1 Tax=Nitrosomonas sp. Nm34 TaxID=1881055 RepID=UPI0008F03E4F|nr:SemiSWEET family transporter [Nitrosomonas sp. Nm34]SFI17295.1 Uncharacterized conserved protein, contains PQ loop repeat [Nitrosomonas sp. Nm34]